MLDALAPIAQLYRINTGLFMRSLAGLTGEELLRPCGESNNPMIWMAAHLAAGRCMISSYLGVPHEPEWAPQFRKGSKIEAPSQYPDFEEISRLWQQVSDDLLKRFDQLSAQDLCAEFPRSLPMEDKSTLSALAFLSLHESYHVGQMGYLRKWLGHPSLVG